jgi:hypothetical protein
MLATAPTTKPKYHKFGNANQKINDCCETAAINKYAKEFSRQAKAEQKQKTDARLKLQRM